MSGEAPLPSGPEVRSYLESKIIPKLSDALTEMVFERPSDPVAWLAQWLIKNNPASADAADDLADEIVGRLKRGDYFGEISLLTNKPRQVTVSSVGKTNCLVIDKDAFERVLGPLFDMLKRNMSLYESYGAAGVEETAKNKSDTASAEKQASEIEEEDDEFADEARETVPEEPMFLKPPPKNFRKGRRTSVSVSSMKMDVRWKPKKIDKSAEQVDRMKDMFKHSTLFKDLDEDDTETIIFAMEEKNFPAGTNIITQGDMGDYFYMLDLGEAEVWIKKGEEDPIKVQHYEAGSFFGELALLHGDRRAATVKAVTDVKTMALDQETFRRILMTNAFKKQEQYKEFVQEVPILKTLSKYEVFRVVDAMTSEAFEDGDVIIREGEEGNVFYIIEKGEVVCTKKISKH